MKAIIVHSPKHKIHVQLVVLLISVFFYQASVAQSWQWLKTGGFNDSGSGSDYSERIQHLETDPQGNIYVAFKKRVTIGSTVAPFNISTYQVPRYSAYDVILASFACDGTLRWTVTIGGEYVPTNISYVGGVGYFSIPSASIKSLKTDVQGNVYVTGLLGKGFFPSHPLHLDPNYTLPASAAILNTHKENFYIAKYNANGVAQWVRFPEAPDVAINNNDRRGAPLSMDVDPNGTVHVYCGLNPGIFCSGALTIAGAPNAFIKNILKYDTNGNYLGNAAVQYEADSYAFSFLHDSNLDRYYFSKKIYFPEIAHIIGGQVQTRALFVAAFDSNGVFLWKKQSDNTNLQGDYSPEFQGLSIDNDSNLYLNVAMGRLRNAQLEDVGIDGWEGQQIVLPTDWIGYPPVTVIKMNSNGDTLWMKNASDTYSASESNKSSINGNELGISLWFGKLAWDGIPLVENNANGAVPGILRLNKDTGMGVGVNYLDTGSAGVTFPPSAFAAGSNGSYYLGGGFEGTISASPSGSPVYLNTGGFDDFFIAKLGSSNCTLATTANQEESLNTYPNPTRSLVYVTNKEEVSYVIYDALGKMIQMDTIAPNGSIDIQHLSKGMYLLQMKDRNGQVTTQKIVKE